MEEIFTPARNRSTVSRNWAALFFIFSIFSTHAQTTNLLNLCTEGALQAAVSQGGIYTFGDCGSNTAPRILLSEPLVVERDLTLVSTQAVLLDGQRLTRVMVVKPGVRVNLHNILFFNGRHTETNLNDGGIPETAGAGLYNDGGIVTIRDGRFEANSVVGVTGLGGADTTDDGEAGGDAAGGGIYNNGGQIVLSNVVFVGNSVTGGTGGAGGSGGNFGGNGGRGGAGGSAGGAAIYSKGGSVSLFASTFTTNSASGSAAGAGGSGTGLLGFPGDPGKSGEGVGGAISGDNGEIVINGCTFFGNAVTSANGLAGNAGVLSRAGQAGRDGGDASGGAVFNAGRLSVTNSTFFANSAKAGTGGAGGASGSNGFGGNGGEGGQGGSATGGAIHNASGQAAVVNCTFSDNLTTGGTGGAGGAGSGFGSSGDPGDTGPTSGGAIYGGGGEVTIANNILANSKVTVGGTAIDRGGNLSTDLNPLLTSNTSLRLANPLLSGLGNNGGPTQTMAIATNSPAINHGVPSFCPPIDQRGTNRLDACDIGAYETSVRDIPASVLSSLTISQQTNSVSIAWPAGYPNLFLQFTTNLLNTNTVWAIATQTATNNGSSNILRIATTNSTMPRAFFRLYGVTNVGNPFKERF
jgi:hypothetical protein